MQNKKTIVKEQGLKIRESKIEIFLDDLGARKPAPGGGSAAALSGALGISLVQMVANFSQDNSSQIHEILRKANKIKKELLKLIDEDAEAVSIFFNKSNSLLKRKRAEQAMHKIPITICQNCEQGLELIPYLIRKGNKNLISDLKIARILLQAGAKGAKKLIHH
ncbi:MAG: cyclodeaminase/cyclohydrolase family protein [Candidatus Omnitrophica bacterium]|nr:cyclodeaminase/cyclohydrolase family protein [Candidatus Omnitrophota bacterium]